MVRYGYILPDVQEETRYGTAQQKWLEDPSKSGYQQKIKNPSKNGRRTPAKMTTSKRYTKNRNKSSQQRTPAKVATSKGSLERTTAKMAMGKGPQQKWPSSKDP